MGYINCGEHKFQLDHCEWAAHTYILKQSLKKIAKITSCM